MDSPHQKLCEYQTKREPAQTSPAQPSSGMQTVVGALKIVVRACPDLVCCVNPEQRMALFVSVGLEYSA